MPRFQRVPVPGDGDCLYHAVRAAFSPRCRYPPSVPRLRAAARAWLLRAARAAPSRASAASLARAARRAGTSGAWGEHEEVQALAQVLRVRIRVWEGANGQWIAFGDARTPTLHLENRANVHFDALVRQHAR